MRSVVSRLEKVIFVSRISYCIFFSFKKIKKAYNYLIITNNDIFINSFSLVLPMRHKSVLITGFAVLIFLTVLLLSRQSLLSQLTISILYAVMIIVQLVFLLIDDELSMAHAFVTGVLFTSLAYLVINLMGPSTLSTFFLGMLFILLFLVAIVLIIVYDWTKYTMFDKMFTVKKGSKTKNMTPIEELIDEPPHFRLKNDDEGEWVELQVLPNRVKAAKRRKSAKTSKKSTSKKSSLKTTGNGKNKK